MIIYLLFFAVRETNDVIRAMFLVFKQLDNSGSIVFSLRGAVKDYFIEGEVMH